VSATADQLENQHVRIRFNAAGEIISLFDKSAERESIEPGKVGNQLRLFEDLPGMFDAWDIEMHYEDTEFPLPPGTVELGEQGPVFSTLIVRRKILDSTLTQRVLLAHGAKRVDFQTRIDWKERHKLLKVRFHTALRARHATYDIAYANIERPTTRNNSFEEAKFEVSGHQWMDLSQPEFGLSLLTDCKYGYEARDRMIGLTMLKGPMYPDPVSDLGEHVFTYSLYPHALGWREAGTIEAAADLNEPVLVLTLPSKGGEGPPGTSFMAVDKPGVTLEAVKRAEEGNDIVVRLVERLGQNQTVRLRAPGRVSAAADCDLLEREQRSLEVRDGELTLNLTPFEIRTIRFKAA
jgi:alpha-mannosidase